MKTMKQFALVLMLVPGATLFAPNPVRAQVDVGTIDLESSGLLPEASGQATLSGVVYLGDSILWIGGDVFPDSGYFVHEYTYAGDLTLTCQGLKPGAKYRTPLGTFTAARDGTLYLSGSVTYVHDFAWVYSPWWWSPPGGFDGEYLGGGLSANVSNFGNKRIVLSGGFSYPY